MHEGTPQVGRRNLSGRKAFGIDPKRAQRYNLRQARYDALAHDIDVLAGKAALAGERLAVLDMGCGKGAAAMHLRVRPNFGAIDIDATDIGEKYKLDTSLYRCIFYGDLTKGYPELPDASYDVVICEQVLEHLLDLEIPMASIGRLVKPGGRAIVGVPIFPGGSSGLRQLPGSVVDWKSLQAGKVTTFEFTPPGESRTFIGVGHPLKLEEKGPQK